MSATQKGLEARVEELETQLAFQDELHERLNDMVARQDQELRALGEQVKALARRLQELRDTAPGSAETAEEIPPHY